MTFAQEQISRAERLVNTAASQWEAIDLSNIKDCVSALESSLAALTAASGALAGLSQSEARIVRAMLAGLKNDVNRLQRLVDAASAFLRNLPGAEFGDSGLYQPGGSTQLTGPSSDSWRLQG